MPTQSFAIPLSKDRPTTCGYCSPPGKRSEEATSYKVAGLLAMRLSCEVGIAVELPNSTYLQNAPIFSPAGIDYAIQVYQSMVDRGWRRAGTTVPSCTTWPDCSWGRQQEPIAISRICEDHVAPSIPSGTLEIPESARTSG